MVYTRAGKSKGQCLGNDIICGSDSSDYNLVPRLSPTLQATKSWQSLTVREQRRFCKIRFMVVCFFLSLSFKRSMVTVIKQSGSLSPSLATWGGQCQSPRSIPVQLHITSTPCLIPAACQTSPSAPLSLPPTSSVHQEDLSTCPRPTEDREEHHW